MTMTMMMMMMMIFIGIGNGEFKSKTIEGLVPNGCVPESSVFDEASKVAYRRDPMTFRKIDTKWEAMSKWKSSKYLSDSFGSKELRIQHSRRSLFAYDVIKPLTRVKAIHRSLKYSRDDDVFMNYERFLNQVSKDDNDNYYYIMASLDTNSDFKDLARDLMPNDFLRLDMGSKEFANKLDLVFRKNNQKRAVNSFNSSGSFNVAMSGNSVSVRSHYDASHNFLVQILGTKRLLLMPPNSVEMYPETHPAHRQIQPLPRQQAQVLEVVLHPGDMVYIPPFWIHHVDYSRDLGISVNLWSQAEERQMSSRAQQISDAVLKKFPLSVLVPFLFRVLRIALSTPSSSVKNKESIITFIKTKILELRYNRIGPKYLNCKSAYDRLGQCDSLVTRQGMKLALLEQSSSSSTTTWTEDATEVGRILSLIIWIDNDKDVRDLILADYVEKTIRTRLTREASTMGLSNSDVLGSSWVCSFLRCSVDTSWLNDI